MRLRGKISPAQRGRADRTLEDAILSNDNAPTVLNIKHVGKPAANRQWRSACRELLRDECRKIAATTGNQRWATFTSSAFMLAGFVRPGGLTEKEVETKLTDAALRAEMHHYLGIINAAFTESRRRRLGGIHG